MGAPWRSRRRRMCTVPQVRCLMWHGSGGRASCCKTDAHLDMAMVAALTAVHSAARKMVVHLDPAAVAAPLAARSAATCRSRSIFDMAEVKAAASARTIALIGVRQDVVALATMAAAVHIVARLTSMSPLATATNRNGRFFVACSAAYISRMGTDVWAMRLIPCHCQHASYSWQLNVSACLFYHVARTASGDNNSCQGATVMETRRKMRSQLQHHIWLAAAVSQN